MRPVGLRSEKTETVVPLFQPPLSANPSNAESVNPEIQAARHDYRKYILKRYAVVLPFYFFIGCVLGTLMLLWFGPATANEFGLSLAHLVYASAIVPGVALCAGFLWEKAQISRTSKVVLEGTPIFTRVIHTSTKTWASRDGKHFKTMIVCRPFGDQVPRIDGYSNAPDIEELVDDYTESRTKEGDTMLFLLDKETRRPAPYFADMKYLLLKRGAKEICDFVAGSANAATPRNIVEDAYFTSPTR